jgi:hypothetical protein
MHAGAAEDHTDSIRMAEEKRKHQRVTTNNVVSYICLDGDGNRISEGMGMTVDISQGGTLIETSRPIESEYILLMSIDLNQNVLETKGRVVHSRSDGPSKYLTGIQFLASPEEVTRIVKNFIIDYHSRKNQVR